MSRLLRRGVALLPVNRKLLQSARYAGTALERAAAFQPGQTLHGYTIKQVTPVPELYLTAVTLTHDKTGAEHLHVARDDSDNAFGVAFKTTPMDSTGVPHILEHTALCGSRRYPVRDPFFKMLNRSLSTFMNAFTANDWTMYPFSTQNQRDYANLLGVYLDAAFFPQLREQDFRQEGWRLEHEVTEDANSPIIFKGIVFNEMKGVFSNSQQLFSERMQNLLLPSHTYGVCSGGDPRDIPDLTWQQLRTFHQSHYHPSNSRFYTYGDLPLEDHLDKINKQALETFDTIDPGTDVPLETRWTEPREAEMTCAPNPMAPDPNKQTTVAVSYLLADVTDTFESFVLSFVSSLLTMGETAPFYTTLIQPNIGSDFAPGLGYNGYTREASFSVGLEGIHKDDMTKVKNIIEETLDQVIKEGFEEERIEMLLHKIEISQRHVYNNFGLYLGVNLISSWNHGAEVTELLQTNESVARLKEELRQNPQYLQHKVKQYFKDNKHKLSLVMSPEEGFEQRRQEDEQQRLAALVDQLTEADKQKIYQEGLALAAQQNAEEDLSCLPSLQISDIERTLPPVSLSTSYAHGVPIQVSEQPTNALTYFRSICNMRDLDEQLKPYVPLFCSVVTKMGAGSMDYRQLSQQIELKTGSFGASPLISEHHSDSGVYEEGVLFSSNCLDRNVEDMFELWSEIFQRLDLSDTDRLQTLTMMSAADLAQSLSGSGHAYAMSHSASTLTPSAKLKETLSGMSQVSLMKTVAEMKDMKPVLSHLKDISAHLLNRKNMRVSINATPDSMPAVVKETEKFIGALRGDKKPVTMEINTKAGHFEARQSQTHFQLPFQVNYASRSVLTVPYTNIDFASLRVLARIMTNKYLHREIREKGGAYGGGASSNSAGILSFYSYRDPNSMTTLSAFDGAVDWALSGNFTQQDIDEAKLSIFQKVDGPVPPGDRGLREFVSGVDDARRDAHREQLFAVTKDDLVTAADRYLSMAKRTSAVTLLGPQNPATKSSTDWKVKTQSQ